MTIMDCVRKIKIDSSNCWFLQLSEWQAIYSDAKLGRKAKERNQVQFKIIFFDISLSYLKGVYSCYLDMQQPRKEVSTEKQVFMNLLHINNN